jgi:hypothetical protein
MLGTRNKLSLHLMPCRRCPFACAIWKLKLRRPHIKIILIPRWPGPNFITRSESLAVQPAWARARRTFPFAWSTEVRHVEQRGAEKDTQRSRANAWLWVSHRDGTLFLLSESSGTRALNACKLQLDLNTSYYYIMQTPELGLRWPYSAVHNCLNSQNT